MITETYSYLEDEFKYYISNIIFCTLLKTFPQRNILDKHLFYHEGENKKIYVSTKILC